MSRSSECQTWECTLRIVDAVRLLYKEERRVCILLECLCPDGVVVISVVVCTCKGYIEEGSTSELGIEIYAVPCEVEVETVCEFRTVCTSDESLVVSVDLSVTIEVDISDVTDARTCSVPCRIVDFLLASIETISSPCHCSAERSSYNLLILRDVRLIRIDDPAAACICNGSADSILERLAACHEMISVRNHHVNTLGIICIVVLNTHEIVTH